jgi:hypothetical protein
MASSIFDVTLEYCFNSNTYILIKFYDKHFLYLAFLCVYSI